MRAITFLAVLPVLAASSSAQVLGLDGLPDPTYAGFYAWFDAAVGINGPGPAVDGAPVTSWVDRTGQGRDLVRTSALASERPTFRMVGPNGLPAVDFDGGDYIWGDDQAEFGTLTGGRTILWVSRADAADGGYVFDGTTAAERTAAFTGQSSAPARWVLYSGNAPATEGPPVDLDTPQVHSVVLRNGPNEHFLNGVSISSGASALAPLGGLVLGARYSLNFRFSGQVSELLVYDEVLSPADRQALEGYLLGKHPITAPPEPVPFVDVFTSGDGLYNTYRIPAVLTTQAGTVLAFAEGRATPSDHAKNDIVMRRSTDGGDNWGALVVLHDDGDNSLNNPCVVQLSEGANAGRILLMYQRYPEGCHESCVVAGYVGPKICRSFLLWSDDDGLSWQGPVETTTSVKPPVATSIASGPGVGIQKRRPPFQGRVVFPFNRGPSGNWKVYAVFSDDGGATWAWGSIADDSQSPGNGNEVQMVELDDGSLLLNSRSSGGTKHRKIAHSTDGGATWTPLMDELQLIEPQCMASILRYTDPLDGFPQERLLYAGPNSQTSRVNGTLHVSYDEGATWPISKLIYPGAFAYSVLTVIDTKTIGVLYERDGTAAISLARVSLEWLTDGSDCPWKGAHFSDFGTGCAGSGGFVPTLELDGCPTPGGEFTISIGDALGGSFAFLAIGQQQTVIPIGVCSLLTFPLITTVGPLPLSAGGPGQGALAFSVSFGPGAVLVPLTLQAFVVDAGVPGLLAATGAVTITQQ